MLHDATIPATARRRIDAPCLPLTIELFESGFAHYCWKRLLTISAEDCAGLITQEIKALHESFVLLNKATKKPRSRMFISKAVIVLCLPKRRAPNTPPPP